MEIEKIAAQLKSFNPDKRKQAMIYLAKHGGKEHLSLLKDAYLNDPEPALRENAKQAAIYIRKRMEQPAEAPPAASAPPKKERLQGAEKARAYRAEVESRERGNLWLFGIISLVVGAVVLWLLLGRQVLRLVDESTVEARLQAALPLKSSEREPEAAGEGKLYSTAFDAGSGFYLQEGSGPMPTGGWTLIVAIFGGTGRDALSWLTRNAAQENFMILTPYFQIGGDGLINTQTAQTVTNNALNIVQSNYQINLQTLTAYGYLQGANFFSFYTANQRGKFAIVSLTEATNFSQQPDLRARYLVLGSSNNEVNDVSAELITRLSVLRADVVSQIFIQVSDADLQQRQWEGTLSLIKAG